MDGGPGRPISGIQNHLYLAVEIELRRNLLYIRRHHIDNVLCVPVTAVEVFVFDDLIGRPGLCLRAKCLCRRPF